MVSRRLRRLPRAAAATALLVSVVAACGGDDEGSPPPTSVAGGAAVQPAAGAALSPEGAAGAQLAKESGCAGCHGADFSGSLGPSWVGLYRATVTLEDGSTVVADDGYLTTAIADPGAQRVAGYALAMPENGLAPEEVAQIVAYIRELSPQGS
jgi:mono/diheme cytochrome c family protein